MPDLNAFNGSLYVDFNAHIGARKNNANSELKLEVTSLLPDNSPDISPVVGITTPNAENFLALSCGNQSDQAAQLAWNRGSVCFGTNVGFDRTTFSEHLRITETGNLGIGTQDPQEKLHVDGAVRGNQNGALRISTGSGHVDVGPQGPDSADFRTDRPRYYFDKELRVDSGIIGSHDEDLQLCTGGTARILIGGDTGNVGIGVPPDPRAKLHIDGGPKAGLDGGGALIIGATDGKNVALDTAEIIARDNAANSVLHLQAEGGDLAVHGRQDEGEKFIIKDAGKVGIGTSEPGASLHVADHMVVGPFAATSSQGGIDVTGSLAEFGFVRRGLEAWPEIPQAGDRYVWYNPDGTARLRTHNNRDLLSVAADGAIDLRGSDTLLFSRTNASGTPTGDGFRIRYDNNFFGTDVDGLIFEKTDANQTNPDGGIAFVNTGMDGVLKYAMTIRGDGRIGIETEKPQASLDIRGRLVLEEGSHPVIYGGTGNKEHGRYLSLLNSPDHRSALGLKTGGLLVSDSYRFANPGKNDLIVKGSVSIGTSSLETKLKVEGGSAKFVTNSGKDPLIISRLPVATASQGTQELRIGLGDSVTTFHYINDEATNKINFRMQNTDTETGGGRNANDKVVMTIFGSPSGGGVSVDGVALKPGGGPWAHSSDIRLKKNVREITGTLDKLLRLRGIFFEWINPAKNGNLRGCQIGMAAQDVENVFPDWVGEDSDGYKYLSIRGFEALTVEGFRELKSEMQEKNATIETRLNALEKFLIRV